MTTATEDPAVEERTEAEDETPAPEHVPDAPLSYVLLTPDEARRIRQDRVRELEREHYRLGLFVEEGDRSEGLTNERAEAIGRARYHASVLGLIEPEPAGEASAPDGLPELPEGMSEPVGGPQGPEE